MFKIKVIGLFFVLVLGVNPANGQTVAQRGVLDLRNTDIDRQSPIPLVGEWQFYWQQLVQPGTASLQLPDLIQMPHLWNKDPNYEAFGFGTYKLRILLPASPPELALSIPDMYTSYNLYINGEMVARNGIVGTTKSETVPRWEPLTIVLSSFSNNQTLDLTLQVANFSHSKGGIRIPIQFGTATTLTASRELELAFSFILTGAILMGGLFFLGLFLFGRSEKAILYFALFCLVYSYRILGTELYPINLIFENYPWVIAVRLEYLSLYLTAAIFGVFVKHLYSNEAHPLVINGFTIVFSLFSASAIFLPILYFTSIINLFFIVAGAYILYTFFIIVKARMHKQVGSLFTLISLFVLFFIFGWDLLEYFVIVEENLLVNFTGYVLFFFLQSLMLSNRFAYHLNEAKEHAETANIAKTHFLSTMGHELRTPLNAVIGLSELLLESKSDEEKTQFAKTIKKSGENLLGIINNILDFTKIESADVELNPTPTHIPTLLADTVKMLGSLIDPKKVRISFRFDDALSDYIEIDSTRLQQILINLLGNAIKFTDEGDISVQVTSTTSIAENGQILFIIKDSGIGIPPEKMNLLFDRFSQIEATRNRKYGGTGLGLVISKRLIESMGGRIWVQSEVEVGTTFYFTIQNHPIEQAPSSEEITFPEFNKGLKQIDLEILVVEDNLINQKVVIKVLERLGFQTDIANNGFEALDLVQKKKYDLVFMDMEMPEMDGIEATTKILGLTSLQKVPLIVAMTANVSSEDRARCLEAGMKDFIAKPITLQTTVNVLNKWFH